jgi:hypothetical protein
VRFDEWEPEGRSTGNRYGSGCASNRYDKSLACSLSLKVSRMEVELRLPLVASPDNERKTVCRSEKRGSQGRRGPTVSLVRRWRDGEAREFHVMPYTTRDFAIAGATAVFRIVGTPTSGAQRDLPLPTLSNRFVRAEPGSRVRPDESDLS